MLLQLVLGAPRGCCKGSRLFCRKQWLSICLLDQGVLSKHMAEGIDLIFPGPAQPANEIPQVDLSESVFRQETAFDFDCMCPKYVRRCPDQEEAFQRFLKRHPSHGTVTVAPTLELGISCTTVPDVLPNSVSDPSCIFDAVSSQKLRCQVSPCLEIQLSRHL